jgi:hypothetical protein
MYFLVLKICATNQVYQSLSKSVVSRESVCDKKRESKWNVLSDEKVQDIQPGLDGSPRKSLKCLAQETGVSLGSSLTAIGLIKFCLYKLAVVDQFKHHIMQQEFAFVISCRKKHDGVMEPQLLFIINGA